MRALVTGGAGFIGSHLSEELVKRGISVSIWDNLFRGRLENIESILSKENRFINIDLSNSDNISKMVDLLLAEKPVYIFHYAAINGTQYFYDIPSKVLDENTSSTVNLMRALRLAHEALPDYAFKVIYASSSETYGEPLRLPSRETDITYVNVDHVRDSYAASKLIGEFYVKLFCEEIGARYNILRLFNVYGPRMVGTKYGQVIPEFICRLKSGEYPLRIYGDGEHMRSFCYVSDNVEMTLDLAISSCPDGVYNIGCDEEVSIIDLGKLLMGKLGLEPRFEFLPERIGDHRRRCPDTKKIRSVIGDRDYISLNQGLEKMLSSAM